MQNKYFSYSPTRILLDPVRVKTLPKSVLEMRGTLNHIAANLNQIAKRRNRGDDLNAMERALLEQDMRSLRGLVKDINAYIS
ncbi:hypothetical protein [Mucilaginibacter sp. OK098]|uniref:hypothetical protein n=1 Tax=Mucilaginibacter sp. OK098 TaxID=1855297 RepID=UPI001F1710FD|nr:hypothetical protein [Mucilaginibacter sp. OK098]